MSVISFSVLFCVSFWCFSLCYSFFFFFPVHSFQKHTSTDYSAIILNQVVY
jgi:hypothetical protein